MELNKCPCFKESNAFLDNGETALCYTCGFKSIEEDDLKNIPQLYQDLSFKDNNNRTFIPSVLNIPKEGICFMDGNTIENARWKVVKNIPILKEEQDKFPKGITTKPDFHNAKEFDRYNFIDAADEIGFFKK